MGGSCSGKVKLSLNDKLNLEISKLKGEEIEIKLVNLLENFETYEKDDKAYIKKELLNYLNSP